MWSKMNGFWEEGPKGKYHRRRYQVYTDKVKVARAVENQRHILIQDPVKDNDDSITEPPPAKHILRSQVDAFDINKCAICQQDKTKLTKNKGARSRELLSLNKTATGSVHHYLWPLRFGMTDAFYYNYKEKTQLQLE